jgi:hypothetical protein
VQWDAEGEKVELQYKDHGGGMMDTADRAAKV